MKNLLLSLCMISMAVWISCTPKDHTAADTTATAADTTNVTAAAHEIGDAKYVDVIKKQMAALEANDIAGYLSAYSDDAGYDWNNGDSLRGKPAITEYWNTRMASTLDSVWFDDHIFIPVKVNTPQANEQKGNYVLGWYSVKAKYKTGKTMEQWMHSVNHFNDAGQIDYTLLFRDNKSISEATGK